MNNMFIKKNSLKKINKLPKDSPQSNSGIKIEFRCSNKKIPTIEIKELSCIQDTKKSSNRSKKT